MEISQVELTFFWLLLTAAFVLIILGRYFTRARGEPYVLRRIQAYEEMPALMDRSIESARRLHISLGSSNIGTSTNLAALASTELVYYLARRQAFMQQVPAITLSDPLTLAITQDVLRKAYLSRDNLTAFRGTAIIWYPRSERSLALGAGIAALATELQSPANIMTGEFGPEIAYAGEASSRNRQTFIGNSIIPEGQAVAYAFSDKPLIGEELFAAPAYLGGKRTFAFQMASVVALDLLRWGIILTIIIAALIKFTN
jgi:hypothetical protein